MKKQVIKELTQTELQKRETELRDELFRLRFQLHTKQLQSQIRLRTTRRELARVSTRLREIELGIN
ncbi:MAG: 50S ribosomal protein L29 [Myxococcales bacterium]|nr:50S ribosomal protein L29 [Myxococcales bacterium]